MTIIAFISQKGGVGKSTLSQTLASEAQKQKQKIKVLLADCDSQQGSSYNWSKIKNKNKVNCQVFRQVKEIWPLASDYDLIIIDGPARTSQATLEIAKKVDLLIQPTGASRLDLVPAVKEFHALSKTGIPKKKLLLILSRIATKPEAEAAREFLKEAGYNCCPIVIYEKASYRQVQNEGKSISEVSYKGLQKQVKELVKSLLGYL